MNEPAAPPPPPTKHELDALLAPLSERDRALVLQQFDALARPKRADVGSYGCMGSFVGLLLLIALPNLARIVSVPRGIRTALLAVGIALVVVGFLLRFLGPTKQIRDTGQRGKRAINAVATTAYAGDPALWYTLAVTALDSAFFSGGPWTVHTYDFLGARKRLGAALPRMIAVETLLRLERNIYPVFTDFTSPRKSD